MLLSLHSSLLVCHLNIGHLFQLGLRVDVTTTSLQVLPSFHFSMQASLQGEPGFSFCSVQQPSHHTQRLWVPHTDPAHNQLWKKETQPKAPNWTLGADGGDLLSVGFICANSLSWSKVLGSESENHRMGWVRRDLKLTWFQSHMGRDTFTKVLKTSSENDPGEPSRHPLTVQM